MEVILDCNQFSDKASAHVYLKEQFGFPDYYGNNLDALYDCLMELSACSILLQNSDALCGAGSYGRAVLDTLKDATRDNPALALFSSPYEAEVKERWGSTAAYREFAEKADRHDKQAAKEGMDQIFAAFSRCMQAGVLPDSTQAQACAAQLQNYITEHFYTCTKEILAGLGQMYVADPRFAENLDRHAAGTAEYVSQILRIYCQ